MLIPSVTDFAKIIMKKTHGDLVAITCALSFKNFYKELRFCCTRRGRLLWKHPMNDTCTQHNIASLNQHDNVEILDRGDVAFCL